MTRQTFHTNRRSGWAWTTTLAASALSIALAAPGPAQAQAREEHKAAAVSPSAPVDFNFQVRPILSDKCYKCHGPDAGQRKAGLRLDVKEGAFGETETGARAVVPGDLENSELYQRITAADPEERMPPRSLGRALSKAEIDVLRRWIEQGAPWKPHWSFAPPEPPAVPAIEARGAPAGWPRNPIDAFVLDRLRAQKPALAPAPEADRERLLRRVTLDLTGLPPTLSQIDSFLNDHAPGAYERQVDRLLASPRFGERMAVDWLDIARYADTYGYQADRYRAMWPWRDWVVRAFNRGLPYDQFITWQLAGDLLPSPTREQVLATAFNRHHRQTNEGGSIEEEFRVEYVSDRVNTFGAAFLGLTVRCARCHDHKYDPISQKEYYQFCSFFNNIDESGLYSHFTDSVPTPALTLATADDERKLAELGARAAAAESALKATARERRPAFEEWLRAALENGKGGSGNANANEGAGARVAKRALASGLIGDFPLDRIEGGKVQNRADASKPGKTFESPEPVAGRAGGALKLSGENNVTLPLGNFDRYQPFSIALWAWAEAAADRAVILHRSRAWTDAGSRGYQLLMEDGKLGVALVHFWPGNALAVRSRQSFPIGRWAHIAFTYDGSSRAQGLALYIDGRRADCEIVRDALDREITGGGDDFLTIGQRFRDRGFKNGRVDEVKVYDRALAPLEVAQICDGASLARAVDRLAAGAKGEKSKEDMFACYLSTFDAVYRVRAAALLSARKERAGLMARAPAISVMRRLPVRRATYVLKRGAYDARGERVGPGTLAALLPMGASLPRDRLGLARWLTDPKHPLTARVAVNRFWRGLFGHGIVSTLEDFGSQGELPSHPELLDWLARRFIDSGWNVKGLLRLIVTSATYRQSSDVGPDARERDPDNQWLGRGPRLRLSAEMLRDAALQASGLLVGTMGGPAVKPYQPPGLWEEKSGTPYRRDVGPGSHRRSLYTYWKRTSPPPAMLTFDATTREACNVERQATITPMQALVLLNDPQFVEAARRLARRALVEAGPKRDEQIAFLFRALTGRRPGARELNTLEALYREQYDEFKSGRSDPEKLLEVGDAPRDRTLGPAEHAALTVLAQALLNFDETIVKR